MMTLVLMKDTVRRVGSFSADFCPLSANYVPTLGVSAACSPHNKQVYSHYSQAPLEKFLSFKSAGS